ncbi:MAG TPA: hypothetical protein VGP07_13525 [Polyangia bacterium]|jgi:hypothetical protein
MAAPPDKDPGHWLHRLSVDEWLAAADNELRLCAEALARRAFRPGVTLARRAAGMAWNAVLVLNPDERFGRSYMEHIVALAADAQLPDELRAAARELRDTPPAPPALIKLGSPNLAPLEAATRLVAYARQRTSQAN